jgi:hypothetical protein
VAGKYKTFSPEFREEAARMVVETPRAIADVARELGTELGIRETSLGNCVGTGSGRTGKSMRKTSRRCSYRSGPGCGSWSARTGNSEGWRPFKSLAYFAAEHR